MPVTARLSKRCYDKFGDEIANELVEWFNSVDSTYRAELRQLADDYFARFDAKLAQRVAELRSEFHTALADELGKLRAELIKWAFVFFATAALAVIGLR